MSHYLGPTTAPHGPGRTHWTLAETLNKYGQKVPALARASGLSKNTVYDIVNGKAQAVTLETLNKLLLGLEQLTGGRMTVDDLIGREDEPDPYAHLFAQVPPFDWEAMAKHIPHWTEEEQVKDEHYWQERREEKQAGLEKSYKRLDEMTAILDGPDGRDLDAPQTVPPREKRSA